MNKYNVYYHKGNIRFKAVRLNISVIQKILFYIMLFMAGCWIFLFFNIYLGFFLESTEERFFALVLCVFSVAVFGVAFSAFYASFRHTLKIFGVVLLSFALLVAVCVLFLYIFSLFNENPEAWWNNWISIGILVVLLIIFGPSPMMLLSAALFEGCNPYEFKYSLENRLKRLGYHLIKENVLAPSHKIAISIAANSFIENCKEK